VRLLLTAWCSGSTTLGDSESAYAPTEVNEPTGGMVKRYGPEGAEITALTIDPRAPATICAGIEEDGLFKCPARHSTHIVRKSRKPRMKKFYDAQAVSNDSESHKEPAESRGTHDE
jgi:hypothetical protein